MTVATMSIYFFIVALQSPSLRRQSRELGRPRAVVLIQYIFLVISIVLTCHLRYQIRMISMDWVESVCIKKELYPAWKLVHTHAKKGGERSPKWGIVLYHWIPRNTTNQTLSKHNRFSFSSQAFLGFRRYIMLYCSFLSNVLPLFRPLVGREKGVL